MNTAESYRKIAAELKARAVAERDADMASEWDHLARCYLRLAKQADSNSFLDLWAEFGERPRLKD